MLFASLLTGRASAVLLAKTSEGRAAAGLSPVACPGGCSSHGMCDHRSGFCWCDPGYGGLDCASEMPDYLDLHAVGPPEMKEAMGRYRLDGMYLKESAGAEPTVKLMHFEEATNGWVVSEFGSPCQDDVCFFGYQKERSLPPQKGYVYGAPEFQVYVKGMVFDDADLNPNITKGYYFTVEYTPDINVLNVPDLTGLNGKYILQPRYVHEDTGKYMILPIDYKSQRTWALAGLVGIPRKWTILMRGSGPLYNMYEPPLTEGSHFWEPLEKGMQLKATCADRFPEQACQSLQSQCGVNEQQSQWIRECCRFTCGNCALARTACTMAPPSFLALSKTRSLRAR